MKQSIRIVFISVFFLFHLLNAQDIKFDIGIVDFPPYTGMDKNKQPTGILLDISEKVIFYKKIYVINKYWVIKI